MPPFKLGSKTYENTIVDLPRQNIMAFAQVKLFILAVLLVNVVSTTPCYRFRVQKVSDQETMMFGEGSHTMKWRPAYTEHISPEGDMLM